MRCFLAFEIPAHIKECLSQASREMAKKIPGVRWVKPEGQHITIHFFGEISEAQAEEIKDLLKECGPYERIMATLKAVDAFPGKKRARVVVATLDEGVDIIRSIYHDIVNRLTALGYKKEERGYTPHITFGRLKIPAPVLERDVAGLECLRFAIDRIVLFKSILGRQGATYEPLFELNLTAAPAESSGPVKPKNME
ncbi:MAG: RNA 2',3'-cyclic phosphodiesterase [Deltaproteobacteria bacterium]|nr:RNA 2',3'-cyclic phosphodiesterase [Deltaproteobacteria bacterium]